MDTSQFDQTLGDLTATLGDATRRGIYMTVRESAEPVTAVQIAETFGIHPNVARHHLDRLANDGYLEMTRQRRSGKSGPGAGRPAKCYVVSEKAIDVQFPPKRHDLLADLLVRVISRLDAAEAATIAEEVGREYGRAIGESLAVANADFDTALKMVAMAMTGLGFDTSAEPTERRLVTCHCPFGETAETHPEIVCRIDQGIIRGVMEGADPQAGPFVMTPSPGCGDTCIAQF